MAKIKVKTPVVELDGDEMTRIMWDFIKQQLILPYLDVDLKYYDLGMQSRDDRTIRSPSTAPTPSRNTASALSAPRSRRTKRGLKEFGLKQMWRSPERHDPQHLWAARYSASRLSASNVPRLVPGWTQPIVIGRHAFGDQYRATDFLVPGAGKLTMTFEPADGPHRLNARYSTSQTPASRMSMYNLDESIIGLCARLL